MVFIRHILKKSLYVVDEYFRYVEAYDAVGKRVCCENLIQNTQDTRDMHEISVGVCTGKCLGLHIITPLYLHSFYLLKLIVCIKIL